MVRRDLRGISPDSIVGYLEAYGGFAQPIDDGRGATAVRGDRWRAVVVPEAPVVVGSISLSRVTLEVDAEPDASDDLEEYLRVRLARGGG